MTENEAAKLVRMVISVCPNCRLPNAELTAKTWALVMPEITYPKAELALVKILREKSFAPTPADIIKAVESMFPEPNAFPPAEEAWKEVISQLNSYAPPKEYSHPLIMDAVKTFDYVDELCRCNNDDLGIKRAQFIKTYNNLAEREKEKKRNQAVAAISSQNAQRLDGLVHSLANKMAIDAPKGK